jgi:hypothetical protein
MVVLLLSTARLPAVNAASLHVTLVTLLTVSFVPSFGAKST